MIWLIVIAVSNVNEPYLDVCNEDVETGPCRQWQIRYYYNKRTHACESFTYGGCQGTGNRFESSAECESVCIIGQEPTFSHNKGIAIKWKFV